MQNGLMIDNWTLETVNDLIFEGLVFEPQGVFSIDHTANQHGFQKIPTAIIQLDAFLSLIVNIVLREKLFVDIKHLNTWLHSDPIETFSPQRKGALSNLVQEGVIEPRDFSVDSDELSWLREDLIERLCTTKSLREISKANVEAFKVGSGPVDRRISLILAGGAGMLARGQILQVPYFGHPHRRRLFEETRLFGATADATSFAVDLIDSTRSKLIHHSSKDLVSNHASFQLPAIALEVIENSSSLSDIIDVAIQLRTRYAELRKWLSLYQSAVTEDDVEKMISHKNMLAGFLSELEKSKIDQEQSSTGVSISVGWFKFDIAKRHIDRILNRNGLRADFMKLAFRGRGERGIDKLLSMFGERNTEMGLRLKDQLMLHYSTDTLMGLGTRANSGKGEN